MDEDSDDGVIFKGSPLYMSLSEIGYDASELEIEQRFSHHGDAGGLDSFLEKQPSVEQIKSERPQIRRLEKVKKYVITILELLQLLPGTEMRIMEIHYTSSVAAKLCVSKAIEDDDSEFLVNFMSYGGPGAADTTQYRSSYLKLCLTLTLVFLIVYGYCYLLRSLTSDNCLLLINVVVCLLTLYLLCRALLIIYIKLMEKRLETKSRLIQNMLEQEESLVIYLRKGVRLIQETALVAKGFTIESQKTCGTQLPRAQFSNHCPTLRKLLFYTARDILLEMRKSTQNLIQLHSLGEELDRCSSYLAFQPLDQYGPCLQTTSHEDQSDEELYSVTDGFSLAAIKGMCHVLRLQLSEFTTRLTLVFYTQSCQLACQQSQYQTSQHQCDKDSTTSDIDIATKLEPLLTKLTGNLSSSLSSLQRSYTIHSSSLLETGETTLRSDSLTSPLSDLHVAVHSLDLHLQAALTRVRSLGAVLEENIGVEPKTKRQDLLLLHDSLEQLLKSVGSELNASQGCWDEAVNRMDRLQSKDKKSANKKVEMEQPTCIDKTETLQQIEDRDPIIVDQVFEGYTDQDWEVIDNTWDEFLTPEEKEKKKQEKEEAKKLLIELKSVISSRAVEMQKRESLALRQTMLNGSDKVTIATQSSAVDCCDMPSKPTEQRNKIHVESASVNEGTSVPECPLRESEGTENGLDASAPENCEKEKLKLELGKVNSIETTDKQTEGHSRETTYCDPNAKEAENLFSENFSDMKTEGEQDVLDCETSGNKSTDAILFSDSSEIEEDIGADAQRENEDTSLKCQEGIRLRQPLANVEERLGQLSGANLLFSANVASLAAARSKMFGFTNEETTFGDDNGSSEDDGN